MLQEKKRVLVVGGCGFLGRYIVEELLSRGEEVVVFDIRESWKDDRFTFVQGSICELATLEKAFQGVTTVIHTASPPHGCSKKLYFQVNVEGTHNVIAACLKNGVSQLIFTSSASVVFDGHDIKGGDEGLPYCKKHLDPYSRTKELAERAVLDANGTKGKDGVPLLTVALRPSGIFGPGDQQAWPGFIDAAKNGKSKYQLGDGKNIMDWTYVENIAYAHVLASEKLTASNKDVAGQAFFITNDEPIPFWDMAKYIWGELDYPQPRVEVPYWLAYYLALLMDLIVWLLSPLVVLHPTFTFFRVVNAGAHRYFDISKAKRSLSYRPQVSLKEGMQRTAAAFQHMRCRPANTGKKEGKLQE